MSDAKFTIAACQMDCALGEIEPNLNKYEHFAMLAGRMGAELVIFPECSVTGYFLGDKLSELAEQPEGEATQRLGDIAKKAGVTLVSGMFTKENGVVYNSQKVFSPKGKLQATYHKAHLFSAEKNFCRPGDQPVVVETPIGKIGLTICYDLLFPEYSRRLIELGADIIVNSTNWINDPYQRDMWGWLPERTRGLASTRALENVAFLAMSCRTGHERATPTLAFDSFGPSCVVAPSGKVLASVQEGEGLALAHIDIKAAELERWRSIATYRKDRRPELYR